MNKVIIILLHGAIGWLLCAATMMIGRNFISMQTLLIIHAVLAPIFFTIISYIYFNRFHFTSPLSTAIIFTLFIIIIDFFIVALLIEKNLEMFKSLLGTWIPFGLVFLSTLITGFIIDKRKRQQEM